MGFLDKIRGNSGQSKELLQLVEAADQGNISAQQHLAAMNLSSDTMVSIRKQVAQKNAQTGNPKAMYDLGIILQLFEHNAIAAGEWFQKAADRGNTDAMYELSELYNYTCNESSDGLGFDAQKALYWLQHAADAGNAVAQYYLGSEYMLGRIISKSYRDAYKWYEKAAQQGNFNSLYEMAELCANPVQNSLFDKNKAIALYNQIMSCPDFDLRSKAAISLGMQYGGSYAFGYPPKGNEDLPQAQYWFYQALMYDHPLAEKYLDTSIEAGGCTFTPEEEQQWIDDFNAMLDQAGNR